MGRLAWTLSIAGFIALSGCAKDPHSRPASAGPAGLEAGHTAFETAEDPPLQPNTYFAAGQLSETQGRYDNAIRQYEQAVKIDPHQLPSLYRLGVVHTQLKQYDAAIDAWKRYIAATDNPAIGYANLGFTQEAAGRIADAEASFKKGISIDPKNQPCHVNYGLLLARQGRAAEALEQFTAVLTPAQAHYNLGSVYEQQSKIPQARQEYETALKLDPTFTAASQRLEKLP
jgi:tetratricopeptide (TPR) repeat protein